MDSEALAAITAVQQATSLGIKFIPFNLVYFDERAVTGAVSPQPSVCHSVRLLWP